MQSTRVPGPISSENDDWMVSWVSFFRDGDMIWVGRCVSTQTAGEKTGNNGKPSGFVSRLPSRRGRLAPNLLSLDITYYQGPYLNLSMGR